MGGWLNAMKPFEKRKESKKNFIKIDLLARCISLEVDVQLIKSGQI
jgi:hypothetical protein